MRRWLVVLAAALLIAVGLVVPLPELPFQRAVPPPAATAEPIADVGTILPAE